MLIATFDIEADGLFHGASTVWCVVIKELEGDVYKFTPDQIGKALAKLSTYDLILGHNILDYDLPLLKKLHGWEFKGQVVDTLLVSRTLLPDRPMNAGGQHNLASWGYRVGRGKPDHEDWTQFSEEMLHRCTEDVEINELTYLELCKEGEIDPHNFWKCDSSWIPALRLEHRVSGFVHDMEVEGFPVDSTLIRTHINTLTTDMEAVEHELIPHIPKKVKQYGVDVKKPFKINGDYTKMVSDWFMDGNILEVEGPFSRIFFEDINLGSDQQVKAYLLSIGWKPTEWNYKKVTQKEAGDPDSPYYRQRVGREAQGADGKKIQTSPKLTEDSYDSLDGDIGQKIAHYLKMKHRRSLLEGLEDSIREDGRISQRITGLASTGRYKHAGIVNIPSTSFFGHEIRQCFTSTEGYSLVGTDAMSCQLRMLAHYMNDPEYTEAVVRGEEFRDGVYEGTDIHTVNGIRAGLISSSDVNTCKGSREGGMPKVYDKVATGRKAAKTFIYGLLFGAGDPKIASGLKCTVRKAATIRKQFLSGLPSLAKLLHRLDITYKKRGYLLGFDGRKIRPRGDHMKLVYLLQTAEAVYMKTAWCYLENFLKRSKLDARCVAFVHDEFNYLVKEGQESKFCELSSRAFRKAGEYFNLNCPTGGDPKVGKNWYEVH